MPHFDTFRYNKRPYGVGLLVAGYDDEGTHIYQVCPSANYYDCKAMSIGARSQSARTYLEKFLDEFPDCDLETLVAHGLRALRDCLPNEVELTNKVSPLFISFAAKIHHFSQKWLPFASLALDFFPFSIQNCQHIQLLF